MPLGCLQAHRPARFRDRARAGAGPGGRLLRAHRRNRRRQVHPGRRPAARAGRAAPRPAWCAKARPAPRSAPNSTCRRRCALAEEAGFDSRRRRSLLLRRTIDSQGKSRAWINGSAATAAQLREVGEQLVDIHGQHAWQSLTRAGCRARPARWLCAAWTRGRCSSCGSAGARRRRRWRMPARRRTRCSASASGWPGRSARSTSWRPAPTSGTSSTPSHTRLSHAQALIDAAQAAQDSLRGDEGGARRGLSQALDAAARAGTPGARSSARSAEVLASSLAQLRGRGALAAGLPAQDRPGSRSGWRNWTSACRRWMSLARRYKRTPAELPALLAAGRKNWRALDAAADLGGAGSRREEGSARGLRGRSQARVEGAARQAAPQLAKAVTQAMQGLGMQGGRFEVALEATGSAAALRPGRRPSSWWRATPAARRGRWARWPRAASCRASRWPSPSTTSRLRRGAGR